MQTNELPVVIILICSHLVIYNLKDTTMNPAVLAITSPYQTIELFAASSGIPKGTVILMCTDGRLPILPKNKRNEKVLINVALLTKNALEATH